MHSKSGLHYTIQPADLEGIARYRGLYAICFPKAHHLSESYLEWLYRLNPSGPALGAEAVIDGELVGQVVAVPGSFLLKGKKVKGLVAMNVAVHPSHQGRHLFKKMGLFLCDLAREAGYAFVMGVANRAATPGWVRQMGFQLVAPLEARIGFGSPGSGPGEPVLDTLDLTRIWNTPELAWRIQNPNNPIDLLAESGRIAAYARSSHPLFTAYAAFPGTLAPSENEKPGWLKRLRPRVILELAPKTSSPKHSRGLYIPLPDRLRLSPLNLIFKSLQNEGDRLDPARCRITFLDFDAF